MVRVRMKESGLHSDGIHSLGPYWATSTKVNLPRHLNIVCYTQMIHRDLFYISLRKILKFKSSS